MSAIRRVCLTMMILLVGVVSTATAQQTGALAGTVRDAQGGVLPGVTVTATGGTAAPAVGGDQRARALSAVRPAAGHLRRGLRADRLQRPEAGRGAGADQPHHARRRRARRRHLQETVTVSGASPVVDVSSTTTQTNITKDLYESIPDRPQPVGDGGPRPRRGHRPARRRRHRGHAAVQPRGVRLGRQPEVVQHRRAQDQLAGRQRRRDDAVLRLRDVRGIQHADGLRHRRERCQRRLHEHGHQVGRQPLHQRPQLLLHERRPAGQQRGRRPVPCSSGCSPGARARPARPATRSTSPTTGARRWAARSSATRPGSSARSAAGGSISCRSARATPTVRRPSTTTTSATSWARRRGRPPPTCGRR